MYVLLLIMYYFVDNKRYYDLLTMRKLTKNTYEWFANMKQITPISSLRALSYVYDYISHLDRIPAPKKYHTTHRCTVGLD